MLLRGATGVPGCLSSLWVTDSQVLTTMLQGHDALLGASQLLPLVWAGPFASCTKVFEFSCNTRRAYSAPAHALDATILVASGGDHNDGGLE